MSKSQPELNFSKPAELDSAASRLPDLVEVLRGRGWRTARELREDGFTDRELRAIVESDGAAMVFSYPGSPGYKLLAETTIEEFRHADALLSQGRGMLRRWVRYQSAYHRRNAR